MATLKTTSTSTTSMALIATTIMVQPLVEGMISTSQTMLEVIITLTLIATRTPVPTVTTNSGPATITFALTTRRFTKKWFLKCTPLLTKSTPSQVCCYVYIYIVSIIIHDEDRFFFLFVSLFVCWFVCFCV